MDDGTAREKVASESADLVGEGAERLRAVFPEAFTEGKVDFLKLRAALGSSVDDSPERYTFSWAGKREAIRILQTPSRATLVPCRDESVRFEDTANLFIEGDNLETLKLLYKAYFGHVKVIYIDPPYNTGNDFIYPDDYADPLETYLRLSGQKDGAGNLLTSNAETSGRFHSAWLSMMYPRLFLARQLLRDDGVIFVSIDDNEVHNLRMLMNEVFGEENFVAQLTWEGAFKNDARHIGVSHEYVVVFARNRATVPAEWSIAKEGVDQVLSEVERLRKVHGEDFEAASAALAGWYRDNKATPSFQLRRFRFVDKNGVYKEDDPTAPGGRRFDLRNPRTGEVIPLRANRGWAFDQAGFEQKVREGRITFVSERSIMVRRYLHETDRMTPQSVFYQPARSASERLARMMGESVFDFPKDETVIAQFIEMATAIGDKDAIVLDFFAGSGTTAHSVLQLNRRDGGDRKFILVQLPEPTGHADFPFISDVGKQRIRKVIDRMTAEEGRNPALPTRKMPEDLGFKVFKLEQSNWRRWRGVKEASPGALVTQMEMFADPLVEGWCATNVLYEIALKEGLGLNSRFESRQVAGATVFRVVDEERQQSFLACLDAVVPEAAWKALGLTRDMLFVCRDKAIDDTAAANLALQCRLKTI